MSCCICQPRTMAVQVNSSASGHIFGSTNPDPEYVICSTCYKEATSLKDFITANNFVSQTKSSKVFGDALNLIEEMKNIKEEKQQALNNKTHFLKEFAIAFRDGSHTDIQLKPKYGPSIAAHRALLAVRSAFFKRLLELDIHKASPSGTIDLPKLSYDELQSFLEFLYSGSLPADIISKHVYSLYTAADMYEIPFLQRSCESWMISSLNSSNALEVLEISDTCSDTTLQDSVINFIVNHMRDIVLSSQYHAFALKNPHLIAQITRALVTTGKVM